MKTNIDKAKEWNNKIQDEALIEVYSELPITFLNLLNQSILNYCLQDNKTGIKQDFATRVINSWLAQDVIKIQESDKGKIKRFNRLENIWLNIVFDARKLGIPLESLKSLRSRLLDSSIRNFSLFKLQVLKSIFLMPQVLVIPVDGSPDIFSVDSYNKWFSKRNFPAHIVFHLEDYIAKEYPNYSNSQELQIPDFLENKDKMLLMYFLRTGDFNSMKIFVKDGDTRVIESSENLLKNEELLSIVKDWSFQKAEIEINDEAETKIIPVK